MNSKSMEKVVVQCYREKMKDVIKKAKKGDVNSQITVGDQVLFYAADEDIRVNKKKYVNA